MMKKFTKEENREDPEGEQVWDENWECSSRSFLPHPSEYSDKDIPKQIGSRTFVLNQINEQMIEKSSVTEGFNAQLDAQNDCVNQTENEIIKLFLSLNENQRSSVVSKLTKDEYSSEMEKRKAWEVAISRFPALLVTMILELIAGCVISSYESTLKRVVLLTAFMPVISAISGNVGLQSATITVRSIATGTKGAIFTKKSFFREFFICFLLSISCASILFMIGYLWSGWLNFGLVVGTAMMIAMLSAGILGFSSPHLFKYVGIDPATCVGPFETAFQDIIGYTLFLVVADKFLT